MLNISPASRNRLQVTLDGKLALYAFTQPKHYRDAAKLLGVESSEIENAVAEFRRNPPPETGTPTETSFDPTPFLSRSMLAPTGTRYATFAEALANRPDGDESIITWDDPSLVCCVDLDWHKSPGPASLDPVSFAIPAPPYAWVTRRGGLRLVYERVGEYGADTLAAASLYEVLKRVTPEGVELKTVTRYPEPDREIRRCNASVDIDLVKRLFTDRDFSTSAREAYLDEHGLEVGARYNHDHCPVDPEHETSNADPVVVTEDGIHCHSCQGRNGNGFTSWAKLCGTSTPSILLTCIKSFTHWDHARYVLETLEAFQRLRDPRLQEAFYRAALTVVHGTDDTRVASVFRRRDFVRYLGYWGSESGDAYDTRFIKNRLAGLPCCINADGSLNNETHEIIHDQASIDKLGYIPLKKINGIRISTRWHNPPDGRPRIVAVNRANTPRYLNPDERIEERVAWDRIEMIWPEVARNVLEFLVYCRGLQEWGVNNPMLFAFTGVSGVGKSGIMELAAAICGDHVTSVWPKKDTERNAQGLYDALRRGAFTLVNEVAKAAKKSGETERNYLDFLLQISPTTTTHILYRGSAPFGDVPILAITDIDIGEEVLADSQLGRRLWYVDLGDRRKQWDKASERHGINYKLPRTEPMFAEAVDSLLSIWIDRYFSSPPGNPEEVAEALSVYKMNASDFARNNPDLRKQFFAAWVELQAPDSADVNRRTRRGYRAFRTEGSEGISAIWSRLHDAESPVEWSRANEVSWAKLLGREGRVRCEVRRVYSDRSTWVQVAFTENGEPIQ